MIFLRISSASKNVKIKDRKVIYQTYVTKIKDSQNYGFYRIMHWPFSVMYTIINKWQQQQQNG